MSVGVTVVWLDWVGVVPVGVLVGSLLSSMNIDAVLLTVLLLPAFALTDHFTVHVELAGPFVKDT